MGDNGGSSQPTSQDELTPQQRAAIVAWNMALGESMTVEKVMRLTGLRTSGAYSLLNRLAGVLPIYPDEGIWVRLWREN